MKIKFSISLGVERSQPEAEDEFEHRDLDSMVIPSDQPIYEGFAPLDPGIDDKRSIGRTMRGRQRRP